MKTNYIKLIGMNFILLSILLSIIGVAGCVPASPYQVKFTQPDNSTFYGYVRGDERASYVETSDYVIKRGQDKWWKYVKNDPQGNLVITDFKVGMVDPKKVGVPSKTTIQSNLKTSLIHVNGKMQLSTAQKAPALGTAECVVILIKFSDVGQGSTHTSFSTSPTRSENHLSPLRFQTFNRKVF